MELCNRSLRDFVNKKRTKSVHGLLEVDIKRALRHALLGLKGLHD
jgi:hypothetical protein